MKYFLFSILSIICLFSFFACDDGDNFTSDPNFRVEFSNDTIRFDTVFTSFGSATKKLKIYNRSENSVNISSIELMNPEITGFRMNVDGYAGNRIENIDLLKKDSLFIFVEVTVDPLKSDNPMFINDSIKFIINGSAQYAYLEAVGQDVELWKGGRIIENDTTIVEGKPLLIFDSIYVKKDATLNIEKNVKLFFHDKAKVVVEGRINARGTLEEPIIFRGDRLDNLFTLVPYDRVPGQWGGIIVDSISYDNHFEYVQIRNAVNAIKFLRSDPQIKKATFINSIVHNSSENGIYSEDCWIEGKNSLFTNARRSALNIIGGQYDFVHCTIANYYLWRSNSGEKALTLSNAISNEVARPLIQANFSNCVITGSSNPGYVFNIKNADFNVSLYNCIIRARENTGEQFVNILWEDPKLKKISARKEGTTNQWDYLFNFELDSISPAKDKADISIASSLPLDIRGVSRLSDGSPDIGCYEWISTEEELNRLFIK